jgi:flagella basal body P-ring formation protein FlgA
MMVPRLVVSLATFVLLAAHAGEAQQAPMQRVAVATRAIARGATLGAGDLEYRDSTLSSSRGPIVDSTLVAAGWVTRRVIAAGEVLRAPAVEPPTAVSANQPVAVEWSDRNVRLTLRGVATRNAPVGSRVSVRMESGRRLETTVVGAGRVRID